MNIYVDSVLDSLPVSEVKLMGIKEAKDEDPPNFILMMYWSLIGQPEESSL